jgi:hypothetical protein
MLSKSYLQSVIDKLNDEKDGNVSWEVAESIENAIESLKDLKNNIQ